MRPFEFNFFSPVLQENIIIAFQAIRSNLLRSVLTALIIAIGITALVAIITSISGIKKSLNENLSIMGANSFSIRNRGLNIQIGNSGTRPKRYDVITLAQAQKFKERFNEQESVSISTFVNRNAIVKQDAKKTNPNILVISADDAYLSTGGYQLQAGRNFSKHEQEIGDRVVIIGKEIQDKLFGKKSAIDQIISIGAEKYRVIGTLAEKGSSLGFGGDRVVIIPLLKGKSMVSNTSTSYVITVIVPNPTVMEQTVGEAIAVFRMVRKLDVRAENNFEIVKSDSLAATLIDNLSFVSIAGTVIGLITLLGASIGLMNIMLVSVTERTREIGIRKALGATPKLIRQQFLVEAVIICQLGGLAGILFGVLIGNVVTFFIGGTSIIPWDWIIGGVVLCAFVGVGSGLYPAVKASKLDPVEALRYE